MAQVVKIYDYISRYERDVFHYPSQFIRLKKENWARLYQAWELHKEELKKNELIVNEYKKDSNLSKWKKFFTRREGLDENDYFTDETSDQLPNTEAELKHYFLDSLFPFQLKWASTTVSEMSFLDRQLYEDFTLKYFLTRFPDTFLLLYKPVFTIKDNQLEGDILLITPLGIELIRIMEFESSSSIVVGDDRTWFKEQNNIQSRILSPMVSIKRTEKVVKSILHKYEIEFPVRKTILSRTNPINFQIEPFNTNYIGAQQHEKWLSDKRNLVSPLKHKQLKVCELLLNHCSTVAVKRPEWDEDNGFHFS